MQQLTVGEDVLKLLCFSLAGCTETPLLFWDGGKQALKQGTGLDWMSPAVQHQTPPPRLQGSSDSDFVVL